MKFSKSLLSLLFVTNVFCMEPDTVAIVKIKCELASLYASQVKINEITANFKEDDCSRSTLEKIQDLKAQIEFKCREELKSLVYQWGWPKASVLGEEVCEQAWYIVYHSDADVFFQNYCLKHIERLWKDREVPGKHYAYLYDRVAMNKNKPQRYGTQKFGDGYYQVEDFKKVNYLRIIVGLGALQYFMHDIRGLYEGGLD